MSFSHHLVSDIYHLLTFHILIFFTKTIGPNCTKLEWDTLRWPSFKIMSDDLVLYARWLLSLLIGCKIGDLWKSSSTETLWKNKIWSKYSLLSPLPKFPPLIPSIIQDGRHSWLCNFWFSNIILSFRHLI